MFFPLPITFSLLVTSPNTCIRLTGSFSTWKSGFCIFDNINKSPTSLSMPWHSDNIRWYMSSIAPWSVTTPSLRVSAYPRITVIGVLNSCDTLAKKSLLTCSRFARSFSTCPSCFASLASVVSILPSCVLGFLGVIEE